MAKGVKIDFLLPVKTVATACFSASFHTSSSFVVLRGMDLQTGAGQVLHTSELGSEPVESRSDTASYPACNNIAVPLGLINTSIPHPQYTSRISAATGTEGICTNPHEQLFNSMILDFLSSRF